ncbi:hypothetical protein WA171_000828, partial [Blastocystis sp. BT1]
MSLLQLSSKSFLLREAFPRNILSSSTLLRMRQAAGRLSTTARSMTFSTRVVLNSVFSRNFSSLTAQEKEARKEKRKEVLEGKKDSLIGLGHKFNQLGGTRVIVAYFGLELACWAGFYGLFKAGLLSPDTIVALMNKYEFTARFSHIIANNPNASLLTVAYAANKVISPIRMAVITAYGTYVVKKRKGQMNMKSRECQCGEGKGHCKNGECQCGKEHCKNGECGCGEGKGHCKNGECECGKDHCKNGECQCGKDHCKGACGCGEGKGHCKNGECECGKDHCKNGECQCGEGKGHCKNGECGCGEGKGHCKNGECQCGEGKGHCKNGGCKEGKGHCKQNKSNEYLVGVME